MTCLAASRLRAELHPLRGPRRWLSFVLRTVFFGALGDVIDDWPPLRVSIVDLTTGAIVYREKGPMGSGDAVGIKRGIDLDLNSLSLDEFCERYEIELT